MKRPEDVRKKLVQDWVQKANQDLAAAEALLSRDPPLLSPSCFHSQQAAEKYIKAYLTWRQVEFPKTHDIGELLNLIGKVDKGLVESLEDLLFLVPYGVGVRYPGDVPDPDLQETLEAYNLAKKAKEILLPFLSEDFNPGDS